MGISGAEGASTLWQWLPQGLLLADPPHAAGRSRPERGGNVTVMHSGLALGVPLS